MNQRLFSVLIFAFVVSAGASLLLYRLIASRVTANAKQPTAQVMLAARNLELGTLVRDSDLRMGDWSGAVPHAALLRKEDVVGRVQEHQIRGKRRHDAPRSHCPNPKWLTSSPDVGSKRSST